MCKAKKNKNYYIVAIAQDEIKCKYNMTKWFYTHKNIKENWSSENSRYIFGVMQFWRSVLIFIDLFF